jgi:hypothetical protein
MVLARGVLEGGRREEDARLRHGNILVNYWLYGGVPSTGLLGWTYPKIGVS